MQNHQFPIPGSTLSVNAPDMMNQGKGKQRRHRHTADEWEKLREPFIELYRREGNTLNDVRQRMRKDYGFEAR